MVGGGRAPAPAASPRCSARTPDVWVIGGGAVYAAFLPHADRLVVTDVDLQVDGDTWAPAIGDDWRRVSRTPDDGLVGVGAPDSGTR